MNEVTAQCVDLSSEEEALAREFMAEVIRIYAGRHIYEMRNLHFRPPPENDGGRWDNWCADHHMQLCENDHKTVTSWVAQPYIEPDDRYHETHQLTPSPFLSIECTLTDGNKKHFAKFACARSKSGGLLACNWALRSKPKKRRPRKLTPEELVVAATISFNRSEDYGRRIVRYCDSHGIAVPPVFMDRTAKRYAVIDLSCAPPKLVALTFDSTKPLLSYLDRTDIDWKRDVNPQMRILDFKSGRQLHHVGGWRLRRGASFVRKE